MATEVQAELLTRKAAAYLAAVKKETTELLTRGEAAAYLAVKPQTLSVWAVTRRYHLPFVKCGRSVRYKKSDLDQFIVDRTVGAIAE